MLLFRFQGSDPSTPRHVELVPEDAVELVLDRANANGETVAVMDCHVFAPSENHAELIGSQGMGYVKQAEESSARQSTPSTNRLE